MMAVSTSRYPVVTHCTVAVSTPNSLMSEGNVMFMAVSTTTPENDMMPQAMTDRIRRASMRRVNSSCMVLCFPD